MRRRSILIARLAFLGQKQHNVGEDYATARGDGTMSAGIMPSVVEGSIITAEIVSSVSGDCIILAEIVSSLPDIA